jgi:hypothetical protein
MQSHHRAPSALVQVAGRLGGPPGAVTPLPRFLRGYSAWQPIKRLDISTSVAIVRKSLPEGRWLAAFLSAPLGLPGNRVSAWTTLLLLRKPRRHHRSVWVIRDGKREISTGAGRFDLRCAERALTAYLNWKHQDLWSTKIVPAKPANKVERSAAESVEGDQEESGTAKPRQHGISGEPAVVGAGG